MKLAREEIQKLILGGLILLGVVYSYFDLLLFPLKKHQDAATKSAVALGPEIQNAQTQIKNTQDLEKSVGEKTIVLRQADAMIPEGSPVAWFPTMIGDFLKRQGIEKVTTKLNTESVEKELVGFRRLTWGIDIPKVGYGQFGGAICALENENHLLEIRTVQIDASRDDAETQRATITLNNLVKQ
ncbi:MAG TPA: hypothetical protein VEO95_06375 [Chthoniobacteraceae bacterium]|nr:hypothetical protein [Chthoniobacteraceae bacterium]